MVRSFVFSQGKLLSQDITPDVLRVMLYEQDVQIWVDIERPAAEETKLLLEDIFAFHPLAIEDCVNPSERPKVDEYENYIFLVLHSVEYAARELKTAELNMFVGKNFLVTYHDAPLRCVSSTIDRIGRNAPLVARAPDRLTYTVLDFLLENYGPAIESLEAEIVNLEKMVLVSPSADILNSVIHLKGEVQQMRQIVFPQREVISRIAHGEFKIVRPHMLPYYRDLLDQLVRIGDRADNYRDSLTNTLQVHLNLQQMQVNRVIKTLTVLATLSMPILIVTSFYGMNIRHVPNADHWTIEKGYAFVLALIAALTLGVYLLLRRKRWT